jgi:hypothetical protein
MPRGQEHTMPSPGATEQLWLQPPLFREHWSKGWRGKQGQAQGQDLEGGGIMALEGPKSCEAQTKVWHPAHKPPSPPSLPSLRLSASQAPSGPWLGPQHLTPETTPPLPTIISLISMFLPILWPTVGTPGFCILPGKVLRPSPLSLISSNSSVIWCRV